MKKAILIFLTFLLLINTNVIGSLNVYAADSYTGSCGDNATYSFNTSTGKLTISGSGAIKNYTYATTPWYSYVNKIKSLTIGSLITKIGNNSFSGCSNLSSISIPSSVNSIGQFAFSGSGLTSVTIPSGITSIDTCAFGSCTSLTSFSVNSSNGYYSSSNGVLFNKNKTRLVQYPLGNMASSYSIPSTVNTLGYGCFQNAQYLKQLMIPNSVKEIEHFALSLTSCASITIPTSVTNVWSSACYGANNINYSGSLNPDWCQKSTNGYVIGDYVYSNSTKTHLICCSSTLSEVTIPNTVTKICSDAFSGYKNIKKVTIPNSVTGISNEAFERCVNLTEIELPKNLLYIGTSAFSGCGMERIIIPNSVTNIYSNAFSDCNNLKDITIKSKNCEISGSSTFPASAVIRGYSLSSAKTYADDYNFDFVSIDSCDISHNYDNGIVVKFATCMEAGIKTVTCTVCKEKAQKTISQLGHSYKKVLTNAASCGVKGLYTYTCTRCNDKYTKTIPALEHNYRKVVTPATQTQDGKVKNICEHCGSISSSQVISKVKTVILSATKYTYDGKVKKPSVTIKDSNGKTISSSNYTVTYASGRKNIGKYSVKITFKGNYSGSKTLYFTINPKATSISSVSSPKSAQVKVKWKKVSNIDGYEIQVSKTSNFTSQTKKYTEKASLTNKTVKFVKKTKSYVRIRTYKKVNGKMYYSSWSKIKNVKTK